MMKWQLPWTSMIKIKKGADTMDIAAMSTMISQSSIQQQASLSVLKLSMDSAKVQSANLAEMIQQSTKAMEMSVNPHLGGNIDIKL